MDATQQIEQAKSKFKPVTVDRLAPPTLDLGHLAIFDPNALQESHKPRSDDLERYLTSISRDSAQLLYNAIFALDTSADADGVFVELPLPVTQVPREKPLPKEKAQTRWEKFAKEKGIQKRKKSRMEYDEATGEYRPRWGYGSAKNDAANDWLIPVPKNADPYKDMYEEKREEKKERIEKNKKQQVRNAAEAAAVERGEDPRVARKRELEAKLRMSKKATASAGVFDRKLDGDVKLKGIKRQFAPTVGDGSVERDSASNVASRVLKKQHEKTSGSIKVQKATGMLQRADERKNRDRKRAAGGDDDRKGGGKKRKFK